MGCCNTHNTDETTSLLHGTLNEVSNTTVTSTIITNRERAKSIYIDKPICKCGATMCLTEVQCCYLGEDGEYYDANVDCTECMLGMDESTMLLWHCMEKHIDDYKYNLCIGCAEKLYEELQKEHHTETKQDKYTIFDKQYNDIQNEINWNRLYELYKDNGRVLTVNELINKYIANHANYKQILANNILLFIDKIAKKAKLAKESHERNWQHEDWSNVVNDVDDISIWYRREEGTDIHSLKTKIKMKCTALDIIVVINEFDLLPELISLIKIDAALVKEYSPCEKIIYSKGYLWSPLKNRDAVVRVEAFESLDEYGEIIFVGKSIDPLTDIDDVKELNLKDAILEPGSDSVRMDVHLSEGLMKPLQFGGKENLTECICIVNVDPKSYLPKALLNWINRTFAFYVAKMIRHRCENLKGTIHAKRVATKPIYRKWKKEMLHYIQKAKDDKNHVLNKQLCCCDKLSKPEYLNRINR